MRECLLRFPGTGAAFGSGRRSGRAYPVFLTLGSDGSAIAEWWKWP